MVHITNNTKMLIENVIHMLQTKISYFWIEKMLVKPLGVKTQNVKFWPLGPISHDASHFFILVYENHLLKYLSPHPTPQKVVNFIFVFEYQTSYTVNTGFVCVGWWGGGGGNVMEIIPQLSIFHTFYRHILFSPPQILQPTTTFQPVPCRRLQVASRQWTTPSHRISPTPLSMSSTPQCPLVAARETSVCCIFYCYLARYGWGWPCITLPWRKLI